MNNVFNSLIMLIIYTSKSFSSVRVKYSIILSTWYLKHRSRLFRIRKQSIIYYMCPKRKLGFFVEIQERARIITSHPVPAVMVVTRQEKLKITKRFDSRQN